MYGIKQSTAITVPFFVHDVAGDAVTALVDGGFTKRISKNGGAFAAMTVTITEMENGFYSFPLSTTHSNTNGLLSILFTHGSSKQINLQFRVETLLNDDLASPTNITAGTIATVTNLTNLPTIPANWLTSAGINAAALNGKGDWNIGKTGYALSAAGIDSIIDETLTSHVTADSLGVAVKDILADSNELQLDWQNTGRLDNILDARMAEASIDTTAGAVDNVTLVATTTANSDMRGTDSAATAAALATVQSDTDDIQTRLPAALVGSRMDSNMSAINNSATAAVQLALSANEIEDGACEGVPTVTTIATDLAEAQNDIYIGRTVIFTSGNARGEATDITDYIGVSGTLEVTALANAPAALDTFILI